MSNAQAGRDFAEKGGDGKRRRRCKGGDGVAWAGCYLKNLVACLMGIELRAERRAERISVMMTCPGVMVMVLTVVVAAAAAAAAAAAVTTAVLTGNGND
jgi:hypothetical protein